MAWLVIKGKARRPFGWAGILATLIKLVILQHSHVGIPAGPFVPRAQSTDAPVIPYGAMQHQIASIGRTWSSSKKLWKEYCDAEEGGKVTWIEACGEDVIEELQDPLLGFGGVTLRQKVTFAFDKYCIFDNATQKKLMNWQRIR